MYRLNKTRWSVNVIKGHPLFKLLNKLKDEKYIQYRTGYNVMYLNAITKIHPKLFHLIGPITWGEFTISEKLHAFTKDKFWDYSFVYDNKRIIDTVMWDGDKLIGKFYASIDKIIIDPKDLSSLIHMGDFEMIRIN